MWDGDSYAMAVRGGFDPPCFPRRECANVLCLAMGHLCKTWADKQVLGACGTLWQCEVWGGREV